MAAAVIVPRITFFAGVASLYSFPPIFAASLFASVAASLLTPPVGHDTPVHNEQTCRLGYIGDEWSGPAIIPQQPIMVTPPDGARPRHMSACNTYCTGARMSSTT